MSGTYIPMTGDVEDQYAYDEWDVKPEEEEAPRRERFRAWLSAELAAAERRGEVRAFREAAEMLEDAASWHVHSTHQVASEALHIAQRRLEHRADRMEAGE